MNVPTTRLSRNDGLRIVSLDCKRLIEDSTCLSLILTSRYLPVYAKNLQRVLTVIMSDIACQHVL